MKNYTSLAAVQVDLDAQLLNCSELVKYFLQNIEEKKHLNTFLEVFGNEALERAQDLDNKEGKKGKLFGLVIAIKDNICYEGHKVSASSKIT